MLLGGVLAGILIVAVGSQGRSAEPCPQGCQCSIPPPTASPPCKVDLTCVGQSSFPDFSTGVPTGTDCVLISAVKPVETSVDEKRRLLSGIPSDVLSLNLEFASLGAGDGLPPKAFGRFAKLRTLLMEFNQLRSLPPDTFAGATSLRTLWLTGNHISPDESLYRRARRHQNKITSLPAGLFNGLSQLRVLLLHHNRITSLPLGLFEDTTKLSVLKLLDNDFEPKLKRKDPVFAPLLAESRAPRCPRGEPSDGLCLQLDLRQDSGDDLEDIWDYYRVSLASEDEVDAVNGKTVPRDARRDDGEEDEDEDEDDQNDEGSRDDL